MKPVSSLGFAVRLAVALALWRGADAVSGADFIRWRARQGKVDAQIESLELPAVLRKLAAATGWNVFIEPSATNRLSAKFKNAHAGDALKLLLGGLNYALVPQRSGPPRLYVFQNGLTQATRQVEAEPAPDRRASLAIPHERLVTLKPEAKVSIEELAARLGAKITGKIDNPKTYRLEFADEEAALAADAQLARESGVEKDFNFPVDRPVQPNLAGSAEGSFFPLKPADTSNSGQTIVALIDTAVQPLPPEMNAFLLPGIQVAEGSGTTTDLSHGTSMAETILHGLRLATEGAGNTSPVRILPVDVYGPNNETTSFDVARGIYSAINAGAKIINLSLSGDGDNPLLANLIAEGRKRGVLFYGAAGNEPTAAPTYPAAYPGVVAVTASDRRGNIAPYANRGAFVDVIAPGNSLVQYEGETFLITGTSASTAYVSGTAAALRAAGQTPDQTDAAIRQSLAIKPPAQKPGPP